MVKKIKIEKIEFSDTGNIEIVHPVTGEDLIAEDGTNMSVTVYSPHSKEFRAAKDAMLDSQIGTKGIKKLSSAQMERAKITMLKAITVSFNGVDFGDGPLEISKAVQEYKTHGWFRDQVDTGAGDNANFLVPTSATSSDA